MARAKKVVDETEGNEIDLRDKMEVFMTGTHPHNFIPKGEKASVHPKQAERWIEKGWAVEDEADVPTEE